MVSIYLNQFDRHLANAAGLLAVGPHPGNVVVVTISLSSPISTVLMVIHASRAPIWTAVHRIDSLNIQGAESTSLTQRACWTISSLYGWSSSIGESVVGVMHDRLNVVGMPLGCARSAFPEIMFLSILDVGPIDDHVRVSIRSGLLMPISYGEKFNIVIY